MSRRAIEIAERIDELRVEISYALVEVEGIHNTKEQILKSIQEFSDEIEDLEEEAKEL